MEIEKDVEKNIEEIEEENKRLWASFLNFIRWVLGIILIIPVFNVFSEPTPSVFWVLMGVLILPPSLKRMQEKVAFLNKKSIYWSAIIGLFVLTMITAPSPVVRYVNADNVILCKEADAATGFVRKNLMDEIKVYDKRYKKNGFLKTEDNFFIKETAVVSQGTPEYDIVLKKKAEKDKAMAEAKKKKEQELALKKAAEKKAAALKKAKEEKEAAELKKILQKHLNEQEKQLEKAIVSTFSDVDLREYAFDYYVDPLVWYNTKLKDREAAMEACAVYGRLKTKQTNLDFDTALMRTEIKSDRNGEVLGSFGLTGYKFK